MADAGAAKAPAAAARAGEREATGTPGRGSRHGDALGNRPYRSHEIPRILQYAHTLFVCSTSAQQLADSLSAVRFFSLPLFFFRPTGS